MVLRYLHSWSNKYHWNRSNHATQSWIACLDLLSIGVRCLDSPSCPSWPTERIECQWNHHCWHPSRIPSNFHWDYQMLRRRHHPWRRHQEDREKRVVMRMVAREQCRVESLLVQSIERDWEGWRICWIVVRIDQIPRTLEYWWRMPQWQWEGGGEGGDSLSSSSLWESCGLRVLISDGGEEMDSEFQLMKIRWVDGDGWVTTTTCERLLN